MYKDGYKIIDVSGGTDSKYGEVIVVKANPVKNNGFGNYHSLSIGSETETFLFPNDPTQLHNIIEIARGGGFWFPYDNNFYEEKILEKESNKTKIVYRHLDFFSLDDKIIEDDENWDDEFSDEDEGEILDEDEYLELIPNVNYKIEYLKGQYEKWWYKKEYPTIKSYVMSQAEDDDAPIFWRWLFENPRFTDDMSELPDKYKTAFQVFLYCFE